MKRFLAGAAFAFAALVILPIALTAAPVLYSKLRGQ